MRSPAARPRRGHSPAVFRAPVPHRAGDFRRAVIFRHAAAVRRAAIFGRTVRHAVILRGTTADRSGLALARLALAGLALAGPALAGCSESAPTGPPPPSAPAPASHTTPAGALASPSPSAAASPTPTCTGIAPGFSCLMQQRITEVQHYLAGRHGSLGIVLDDRVSGAVWHNGRAHKPYPAASTMKLAVLTDLLLRNRRGRIHFTATDWRETYQALHTSNDTDANDLWRKYENASFLARIRAFGMAQAHFEGMINWGYMYCSAKDLDHLMNYVLTKTPASVRDYLVRQLQHVSLHDQQWGVWGAGPENEPGNKDGWEQDRISPGDSWWITNTVGFAGPAQEYTLAVMDNLYNYGGIGRRGFFYGVNTLTQIASILFRGQHTAAPHPQPSYVP